VFNYDPLHGVLMTSLHREEDYEVVTIQVESLEDVLIMLQMIFPIRNPAYST